ncbi:E3 ubiquitin-protein ligase rnf168 isoform X1 [Poecilia latipinna]|uniref:RING-type E3 ubiquitin transferase n=1 Tax=Poecilia latipinna TaxID=48699 RepID=A0A3B3V6F9_9TELE|nr:PREDICTED: E3 ubiquitin-protein ligase RNF168 isoform X1 [Poecilia latipinna]
MSPVSEVEEGGRQELALTWEDCLCPVCLDIFIEPVTLPCTHSFCKGCFLESVDKATLCCPMCRKRVSSWARRNNKKNTLVNLELWNRIQTLFPLQCQRRLNGQDAEEEDRIVPRMHPRVCPPGELRQEYEDQVTKLMEERRAQDEEESKASEELIQKLLAEEQQQLQEEMRRKEEDERLAKLLSNQLNSQENLRVPDVAPVKKKKEVVMGHMDRFLCPCPPPGSASGFITNKENILLMEAELHPEQPRPPVPSKRKSSELDPMEEEEVTSKRVQVCSPPGEEQPLPNWEAELQVRQQQEEDDLHLALLLQREMDQEERRRATDRSKGSSDPYLLRPQRGGTEEAGPSRIPAGGRIRRMRSSSVTNSISSSVSSSVTNSIRSSISSSVSFPFLRSASSASVVSRGSKQVTLTEMFTLPRSRSSASAATRNAK